MISVINWDNETQRDFNLRKEEARNVATAIARIPEWMAREKDEGDR